MYNNFHLIGNNKNNKLSYPLLSIINYNIYFLHIYISYSFTSYNNIL